METDRLIDRRDKANPVYNDIIIKIILHTNLAKTEQIKLVYIDYTRTPMADCINIGYFIQWIRDSQWITLSNLVMLSNLDNPLYKTILGYLTFG